MYPIRRLVTGSLGGLVALCCGLAGAQQVYRIVGPDGRVTYSDRPPAEAPPAAGRGASTAGAAAREGGSGVAALPFELRAVAQRFPVTLYSSNNCGPCGSGRALLAARGVPFAEKTVNTQDDIDALARLTGGEARVPLLTIGSQQLRGFSETEWAQYLDAAGYPKVSRLPGGWRNPPATPMVAVQVAPAPAAAAAPEPEPVAPMAPPPSEPSNPAGIRF